MAASEDTEVLMNEVRSYQFDFSDEFIDYLISVGYGTPEQVMHMYRNIGIHNHAFDTFWKFRTCPILIGHVRTFGLERASGRSTKLCIRRVPATCEGRIVPVDLLETLEISSIGFNLSSEIKNDPEFVAAITHGTFSPICTLNVPEIPETD